MRIDDALPLVHCPAALAPASSLSSPSQSIRGSPPSRHHQPGRREGKRRRGGEKKRGGKGGRARGGAGRRAWRRSCCRGSCSSPTRPRRSRELSSPHRESSLAPATSSFYPHRERRRLSFLPLGVLSSLRAATVVALLDQPSSHNCRSPSPWTPRVQGAGTPHASMGVPRARSSPAPRTRSRLAPTLPRPKVLPLAEPHPRHASLPHRAVASRRLQPVMRWPHTQPHVCGARDPAGTPDHGLTLCGHVCAAWQWHAE